MLLSNFFQKTQLDRFPTSKSTYFHNSHLFPYPVYSIETDLRCTSTQEATLTLSSIYIDNQFYKLTQNQTIYIFDVKCESQNPPWSQEQTVQHWNQESRLAKTKSRYRVEAQVPRVGFLRGPQ